MRQRRRRRRAMAEINVVPYIDVCLVLLIVFMVTAPAITTGVKVALPQASSKAMPAAKTPPIIVTVDSKDHYYVSIAANPRQAVNQGQLSKLVAKALHEKPARKVYVKGDQNARYDYVVQAMTILQHAGAKTVGLITDDRQNH